jgi:hypothetical protein
VRVVVDSHMASPTLPALDPEITTESGWIPGTDTDRDLVRRQVERILASPLFRNSKRFPAFVQYTVEHALKADAGSLKERTIGIEVFGREPTYDTSQDPVVRMTAGEVRKRLAHYYQAPEARGELRILYEPGSYVPEFAPVIAASDENTNGVAVPIAPRRRRAIWLAAAAVIVLIGSAALLANWRMAPRAYRAIDQFWEPFLRSPSPVLLCIGDPVGVRDTNLPAEDFELIRRNYVRFTDSATLALLVGELGERQKAFRIRRPQSTEFTDLRDGPSVLIGGFNNPWTLRLSEDLRFTLASDGNVTYIRDRQQPASRAWSVTFDPAAAGGDISETYGIATRMLDTRTGQTVLMTSGLRYGTRAAAECLVDDACMEEAKRHAPNDWPHENIQIVVATKVIAEDSGPPRIVAVHLW